MSFSPNVSSGRKTLQAAIVGLGTVGRGTFNVLSRNAEEIERRAGCSINVKTVVVRNLETAQPFLQGRLSASQNVTLDLKSVLIDPEIDVIIEVMGGTTVAKDLVLGALRAGKHVVTANKALLALHGNELFEAARQNRVVLAFEAAVAGGIPIIKALREGLTANQVDWVAGIINGTTNFILSEMRSRGASFHAVLKEAQALGYAEADPTFDVEGVDAAHKATILASIAFGVPIQFDKAHVEGISNLQPEDIRYAEQLGYRIKLLGIAKRAVHGIELRVHPTLIPTKRLIANVEGAMNAVMVRGDAVGTTLYYGKGAGSEPTASAVIADLVDLGRNIAMGTQGSVPALAFQHDSLSATKILPIEEVTTGHYLRMRVADEPGVLADITRVLADGEISIDALFQREADDGVAQTDIIMLTHPAQEGRVRSAILRIESLPTVLNKVVSIRIEQLPE
jgi:homoserine dehydrogenase